MGISRDMVPVIKDVGTLKGVLSTKEKLLMQSTDTAGIQPLLLCFSASTGLLALAAPFQECLLLFSNQYEG